MNKDMEKYLEKAEVLIEALPYIQRFNRRIFVVKYGGSAMVDEELKEQVIKDVTLLKLVGFKPIIVHGGGKEISRWVGKVDVYKRQGVDCLKMLPFLFAAFLLIEALEHHGSRKLARGLARVGKAGPVAGALVGCIPQCGFSVIAANLYAGGVISPGTLLAVFVATSDEAVLILSLIHI